MHAGHLNAPNDVSADGSRDDGVMVSVASVGRFCTQCCHAS